MSDAFADLKFLMSSQNRLAVLAAIAEEPRTGDDLVRATDTSTVTIGRILDDFLERRWIERRGDAFGVTVLGRTVAEDTAALKETVEIAHQFQPVSEYFTATELDFDPRLLADATISRSPSDSAFDHVDRWATLFRSCDTFKRITTHLPATLLDVFIEGIRHRDLTFVGVLSGECVDELRADPEKRRALEEVIDLGADLYRYDDAEWHFGLGLYDDDAMSVAGFDEVGTPKIKVESSAPALRAWADEKFQTYRAASASISFD